MGYKNNEWCDRYRTFYYEDGEDKEFTALLSAYQKKYGVEKFAAVGFFYTADGDVDVRRFNTSFAWDVLPMIRNATMHKKIRVYQDDMVVNDHDALYVDAPRENGRMAELRFCVVINGVEEPFFGEGRTL